MLAATWQNLMNSLCNLSVYNPGAQASDALKRGFIVRLDVLQNTLVFARISNPKAWAAARHSARARRADDYRCRRPAAGTTL